MNDSRSIALTKKIEWAGEPTGVKVMWVTAFAVLTAVGARIEIPHQPVPYTLQTFFVLLAGATLGSTGGFFSMCLYLFLGITGLPVFSGAGFGLLRILGPTGGYLLSFPLAAWAVGYLVPSSNKFVWQVVSMFLGLLIVFSLGTIQLNLVYLHDWKTAWNAGFLIFSWWDAVKLFGAAVIAYQYRKHFVKRSTPS